MDRKTIAYWSIENTKYRPDFRLQKLLSCWTSQIYIIKVVVLFSFFLFLFLFFFYLK